MDRSSDPRPQRPVVRQSGETVPGSRPGDHRLRVARRPETQHVPVPTLVPQRRPRHPAVAFVYSFGALILVGTVVLMLPISSASGQWTGFLDALFTSTSAVCLTGLVVVDTGTYWSGFGQVVILLLFQIGGIGFMTSSTLLLLMFGYSATLRQRLLLREALGTNALGSVLTLARKVVIFTFVVESVGAIVLTVHFLREMSPLRALWWGVFHAVSAFNNAGFDLIGGYRSLIPYNRDLVVLLTIALLMLMGAISYTVVEDIIRQRRFVRLTLDTKLVLVTTAGLVVLGALALLFTERTNPFTLGAMDIGPRVLNAFFLSITRTGGFSSVEIGQMTEDGLLVLMALMFIGGAAGSTAGGIKVQTFSLLFFAIISSVRGRSDVEAFRRRVPVTNIMRAQSVALLVIALVFVVFFSLNVTERFEFSRVLFEAFSAVGTVGLSTGITPETTAGGRVILILAMFIGRLGPLTLALALAAREVRTGYRWAEETVKIG